MTISKAIALNKKVGHHWFGREAMNFFSTRIESVMRRKKYFITSDQQGDFEPRLFTVREFNWATGAVSTKSKFQEFKTREDAYKFINQIEE